MLRGFIKFCMKIFSLIVFRVKTIGQENIEKGKPYIMCANHRSNWDAPILVASTHRKVYVMAKAELFVNGFIKWLAKKCCIFPVKRGKQDIEAIKTSLKILNENEILMIFPEGTRNGYEKRGKLQNGTAYMVARSGVPVIPVRIIGEFKPFHKIIIEYGKPLDFSNYQSKKPEKENLDMITEKITQAIFKIGEKNKI